jgi:hypothetical protein
MIKTYEILPINVLENKIKPNSLELDEPMDMKDQWAYIRKTWTFKKEFREEKKIKIGRVNYYYEYRRHECFYRINKANKDSFDFFVIIDNGIRRKQKISHNKDFYDKINTKIIGKKEINGYIDIVFVYKKFLGLVISTQYYYTNLYLE